MPAASVDVPGRRLGHGLSSAVVGFVVMLVVALAGCGSSADPVDDDDLGGGEDLGAAEDGAGLEHDESSGPTGSSGRDGVAEDDDGEDALSVGDDGRMDDGAEEADVDARDAEPSPVVVPEPFPPFEPHPAEPYPNGKRLGALVAQTLTTYDPDDTAESVAARVADDPDAVAVLAADAAGLVIGDAFSRGEVVYAQLGGVTKDAASIMVVVRQSLWRNGEESSATRALDVRLRLEDGEWRFDRLAQDGGPPVSRPDDLSDAGKAVLEHPRIWLPTSARWDIHEGIVDERLLALMVEIAEDHEVAVVSLVRGHPLHVFGKDHVSEHIPGYAVDVYKVDGEIIAAQREEGSAAHTLSRRLFDDGLARLGSPWAFDGFGGRSFTDVVHHDHLHISVGPPPKDDEDNNGDADEADGEPVEASEG